MNRERKNELSEVVDMLDEAVGRLQDIQADEQDAYDNMPEGLQGSSKGDKMLDAIDKIDVWIMDIEKTSSMIQEYVNDK